MRKETGKQVVKTYNKSISGDLIGDIRRLIETARHNVAVTVNAGLTILYWQIGNRIRQDILNEKRAEYGKEIVATVSQQLSWRQNLRSAGDITPAIKYPKAVIPAKAGIQENMLDAGSSPA